MDNMKQAVKKAATAGAAEACASIRLQREVVRKRAARRPEFPHCQTLLSNAPDENEAILDPVRLRGPQQPAGG
jgi:hypothetical protein